MRSGTLFLSLLFVCSFWSCNNKNALHVTETNCREEVPVVGNLSFVFDKNLAHDSMLDKWTDVQYIAFKPAIRGKFQWKHANELVFSPEKELAPSTNYTATFQKDLVKKTKYSLGDLSPISFHTPWLTISSGTAQWISKESLSSDIVPEITLQFNYDVKPADVFERVRLMKGSEKLDLVLSSTDKGRMVTFRVNNLKAEDRDYTLNLELGKGLKPIGGNSGTLEKTKLDVQLPSPFQVVITDQQAEHDGITGTVRLFTSQNISASVALKDFISIEPSIPFRADLTEGGILVKSEGFQAGKDYEIRVKAGLRGNVGGTMKEDYANPVVFGQLEPSISFMDQKGIYLGSQGLRNLEIKINNVKTIKVTVSKIYENNLLNARRNGYYPGSPDYYEEWDESSTGHAYYGDDYDYTVGDVVYEKEYSTKSLPRRGSSRILHFDAPDLLKDYKGIYHVQVSSTEEYYLRDAKFLSLSDLGLIARQSRNKVCVFVNSISTAGSLGGVRVTLYGNNNQVIGNASTNTDGYAEIPVSKYNLPGFKPSMVVAKSGNDFNYLPFNNTMVETSRFDIGGVYRNSTGLRAFVYGDRDIYRPGEQIHLTTILRNETWQSPGNIPVKIKILLPNGKDLKVLKKSVNDQGSMETSLDLSPAAVSGHYTAEVYTSNDILLASKTLLVEEFMPDRIKVRSSLNKTEFHPGDSAVLTLNAVNYFGPPAADRHFECDIQIREKAFQPKAFPRYNFSLSNSESVYENALLEGMTDAAGNARTSYGIPAYLKDKGLLQASFYTTVFDESGRPVSRVSQSDIVTQETFFGIHNGGYSYFALNQSIRFQVVALNRKEQVLQDAVARVIILRKDYKTVLSRAGDYFRYESQMQLKTVEDKRLIIHGSNSYIPFVARTPGEYEIRISNPGSNAYVSSSFYSYGPWGDYGSGFEVNREGNVDIETDRTSYQTGQTARLLFKTPFNGRMLVTVEGDELMEYHYLDVRNRSASLNLPLNKTSLPNVYVSATLFKPHGETEMPLTVAHGYVPLLVEEPERRIPVKIVAPPGSRSRTRQKVTIKAVPGCKVTLAAVDEGILQLTGYKTPDPYAFFYSKKALEITAFDLYPLLLPEVRTSISFTGGDGYDLNKRVNPLPNKRVKLVSSWSGITDAGSGEVSFNIDIPQFSGEIRLMAVAYKDERFGSAEQPMKVADPVVISSALPRFLTPGDTVLVPVSISNTTATASRGVARMKVSGPIQVVGNSSMSVSLKPNQESSVVFKLVTLNRADAGKITVEMAAGGETYLEETDITIRPASSLVKTYQNGYIDAGSTRVLEAGTSGFIPGSGGRQLMISRSPIAEFGDQLRALIQYPYGCTEQTISSAFPQLYFSELSDHMGAERGNKSLAVYNVQEAIRRIRSRQLYNGAVTLWDAEGTENWWATAYAAHFLLEAEKAGFETGSDLTGKMLDYLASRVKMRESVTYYYNRNQSKVLTPKEMAYSLFVLSLAGRNERGTMNYYKQNPGSLAPDSRYLLSAAFALAGDRRAFNELLPRSFTAENAMRENGGSFSSELRDEALSLYALLSADAGNIQVATMAQHVSRAFKSGQWLSTQERTFGLLALGKIAKASAGDKVNAVIRSGGKIIGRFTGTTLVLDQTQLGQTGVEIQVSGKGKLYYTQVSSGIPVSGQTKEEDQFIKVRKQFYDRYGSPLTTLSFKQNDLLVVGIRIEKSYQGPVKNVVITDMLPAGLEIENPRIHEIPGMFWIKNEQTPVHRDIRDDRINLFVDLDQPVQMYYYAVRAVSTGSFKMGPVMADAMYDGSIHSYNGAGKVRVVGRN